MPFPTPTKPAELHTAISTLPFAFVRSRDRARARAHETMGSGRGAGRGAGFREAGPCRWVRRRRRICATCSPGPVSTHRPRVRPEGSQPCILVVAALCRGCFAARVQLKTAPQFVRRRCGRPGTRHVRLGGARLDGAVRRRTVCIWRPVVFPVASDVIRRISLCGEAFCGEASRVQKKTKKGRISDLKHYDFC